MPPATPPPRVTPTAHDLPPTGAGPKNCDPEPLPHPSSPEFLRSLGYLLFNPCLVELPEGVRHARRVGMRAHRILPGDVQEPNLATSGLGNHLRALPALHDRERPTPAGLELLADLRVGERLVLRQAARRAAPMSAPPWTLFWPRSGSGQLRVTHVPGEKGEVSKREETLSEPFSCSDNVSSLREPRPHRERGSPRKRP